MSITPFSGLIDNIRNNFVYMSTSGNDNNTGEEDSPVKTLKRALEIASEFGRGVYVKFGQYDVSEGFDSGLSAINCAYRTYNRKSNVIPDDLKDFVFYDNVPIMGELVEILDLTGYTISAVRDTSNSYTTITFSPSPNWAIDQFKGKIFQRYPVNIKNALARIISNTANTITINLPATTSMIVNPKIYDCPTFILPSSKDFYISLDYSVYYINFNATRDINIGSPYYNSFNTQFKCCYFYSGNSNIYRMYHNSKYWCFACMFDKIRIGHCAFGGNRQYAIATHWFSAVLNSTTESAFVDIDNVVYCSAWNCNDFFQTGRIYSPTHRYNITNAGGSGNTGAFINTHYSGETKNTNSEILINTWTTLGNPFTINCRDIIVENGYKISLDTIPYNFSSRQKIVKLIDNDIGARIWIKG